MNNGNHFGVFVDTIAIAGFFVLIGVSFSAKRERARWAKGLLFAVGLVGIICYSLFLARDMAWLPPNLLRSYRFHYELSFINGWLLGSILALVFAGQIIGKPLGMGEIGRIKQEGPHSLYAMGLQQFSENVWIAGGPSIRALGFAFSTRMIVVKLGDGALWVNSPVSVSPDVLGQIKALGPVRYLVAPTKMHVWRLDEWHQFFPEAELWMPPQIPGKLNHPPIAGILGDTPPSAWAGDLDQLVFKGNLFIDEVFFFHKASRTVIMADFIQNHPMANGHPARNALLKLAGVAYPNGGIPIDIRLSFIKRRLARESLNKLLSWDFDKLIIAHGICVEENAKSFVKRAFRGFAPNS
jgi:hypothetical protein